MGADQVAAIRPALGELEDGEARAIRWVRQIWGLRLWTKSISRFCLALLTSTRQPRDERGVIGDGASQVDDGA